MATGKEMEEFNNKKKHRRDKRIMSAGEEFLSWCDDVKLKEEG